MKAFFLVIFFSVSIIINAFPQKPLIDTNNFNRGMNAANKGSISNNGAFISYKYNNILVLMSADKSWKREISGASDLQFSNDSHNAIYSNEKDSITIAALDKGFSKRCIPNVGSWQIIKAGNTEFLAYMNNAIEKQMILYNLNSNKEITFDNVNSYFPSANGKDFLLLRENNGLMTIDWLSLSDFKRNKIFEGRDPGNFIFDKDDSQLCFTAKNEQGKISIWYYNPKQGLAKDLLSNYFQDNNSNLTVGSLLGFTDDGHEIVFKLIKPVPQRQINNNKASVDLWSYSDVKLQSEQLIDLKMPGEFISVISLADQKITQLENENETIFMPFTNYWHGDFIILKQNLSPGHGSQDDWNWNKKTLVSFFLLSIQNGTKKELDKMSKGTTPDNIPLFSPEGHFIVYFDPFKKNYFCYSIMNGNYKNITKGIPAIWSGDGDWPGAFTQSAGIAGFVVNSNDVIIYSQNDIFQISLTGTHPAINLTNRLGQKKNITFRLAENFKESIDPSETLLLRAFNKNNKESGFFTVTIGAKNIFEMQNLKPYKFDQIIKAKDSNIYLVSREDASESPNYFLTSDLRSYTQVSDIHPEKAYNWISSELIAWKTFDGSTSQGILYKPENFDPKKKYPIIFNYYEILSNDLHAFQSPDWSGGEINIPYFVSNGYLVFQADIHYSIGHTGKSAYNSIVSAAKYLAKMPYVDAEKMGLQGQSFGAYETEYIVAHTNVFAAACPSSGWPDFTSTYGEVRNNDGTSREGYYELKRERMGASLWERPDLYIDNSPIFRLQRITTPLLMMNNKQDDQVHFSQGELFFIGLRRLGKKAWMCQYDNSDHFAYGDDSKDWTIRMKQFFDYYLKGARCPKWMAEGVPARLKGIDDGLELEPMGVGPGPNLLTPKEQKKVDSLATRKPITLVIP